MNMEKIIDPIDIKLIKKELTSDKKIGDTNKGGNELYVVTWQDSPNVVKEIGRIKETTYRMAGACSGLSMDLDRYDTMENPYKQLIVWDPDTEAIIGGYRYILGPDIRLKENHQPDITSSHLYHYSKDFINEYLPHVMELGRSFVAPEYQSSKGGAKSLFTLDNLWDGITSVILEHPGIIWFLGKMTIYPSYNPTARNLILHFLNKHFHDTDKLATPYNAIEVSDNPSLLDLILRENDLRKDYRLLKDAVRRLGTQIPPLVNSYINTSSTMKMLGSSLNDELGNAVETGIMVCFNEIYDDKKSRHIDAFISNRLRTLKNRFPSLAKNTENKLRNRLERNREKAFIKFTKRKNISGQSPDIEFR